MPKVADKAEEWDRVKCLAQEHINWDRQSWGLNPQLIGYKTDFAQHMRK